MMIDDGDPKTFTCWMKKGRRIQKTPAVFWLYYQVIFCVVTSGFLCYIHILLAGLFAVASLADAIRILVVQRVKI